jgi:hypothetical protein
MAAAIGAHHKHGAQASSCTRKQLHQQVAASALVLLLCLVLANDWLHNQGIPLLFSTVAVCTVITWCG